MDTQAVCYALCGLQCLGDREEVRGFISRLTPTLEQRNEKPNVDNFGDKLCGLQRLWASYRTFASRLTPTVQKCTEKVDAQTLHALYWLHRLAASEDVCKLYEELTWKIEQCPEKLDMADTQTIRRALLVLHRLGDSEEALNCAAVLTPAIDQCFQNLIAKTARNALFELISLGESERVKMLIAAWNPMIDQSNVKPHNEELDRTMFELVQAVSQALHGAGPKVQ
jgi:hypothetical protein